MCKKKFIYCKMQIATRDRGDTHHCKSRLSISLFLRARGARKALMGVAPNNHFPLSVAA